MRQDAWVVSDLHLGAGGDDPLEDFRDDGALADFIRSKGRPHNMLVINGDFVDFLQIELGDTPGLPDLTGLPPDFLWDESTSKAKLAKAALGHAPVFAALRDYVKGGGSLRFTIGNHDLDLVWPAIQREIRKLVDDHDEAVVFALEHKLFERVHIEHGHRFTRENCPQNYRSFRHTWAPSGRSPLEVLECVWGSRFVLDELNPIEATHPFIDNVKPTWKVAYHMLVRGDWLTGRRSSNLVTLVQFLRQSGIPIRAIADALLEGDERVDGVVLERAFEDPEWRRLVREIRHDEPDELEAAIQELSAEDRAEIVSGPPIDFAEDPSLVDEGNKTLGLFRDSREERAAEDCLRGKGISHVVFGHTHDIVDGADGKLDGAWWNPGSWIPHLDVAAAYVKAKGGLTRELVSDKTLYRTDRRCVHLVFEGDQVDASLERVP